MANVVALVVAVLCVAAAYAAVVPNTPATAPCSNHGSVQENGACECEKGFTGTQCELVVVNGKMHYVKNLPVTSCTVKVYGSDDLNEKSADKLLGQTTCNDKGAYSIAVPHRPKYVVSGTNDHGTEARQFFHVPQTKEARIARATSTRNRRSHLSDWQNPTLLIPGWMTGEEWYAHIFWGWDHTAATCDLNLFVHTPYMNITNYPLGCTADTHSQRYNCRNVSDPLEHMVLPETPDSSCNSNQYGYGYENFYIWEVNQGVNFEIFAYNPNLNGAAYQNFRDPNLDNDDDGSGVFATAAIYTPDENGYAQLQAAVDVTKSSQSSLNPGLYWHIASLQVDTIPDNVQNYAAGNGTVTVRNNVYCQPSPMIGTNVIQPWEQAGNEYYRGLACGKQF